MVLGHRMTHHAIVRARQRGVRQEELDLLLEFGEPTWNGSGATIISMNSAALRCARRELGREYGRVKVRDLYAVNVGGNIVTIGRRHGKLKNTRRTRHPKRGC